jgi:hypothetical protein
MAGETETTSDRQQRLERAVADYLEAADAGRDPDPAAWLARYSDLQPELGQFLADQARLDRLVGPLRPAVAGGGCGASPPSPTETALLISQSHVVPAEDRSRATVRRRSRVLHRA